MSLFLGDTILDTNRTKTKTTKRLISLKMLIYTCAAAEAVVILSGSPDVRLGVRKLDNEEFYYSIFDVYLQL